MHQSFIDLVKTRRGAKLDKADVNLFTGEFWSGKRALELGLIDGLSDLRTKMREIYGDDVRLKLVTPSTSWFRRRRGVFAESGTLRFRLFAWRICRRSDLGDRGARALVALRILAMPQVLLLIAAGAGLVLAGRRWYVRERARIAAELRAAEGGHGAARREADRAAGARPADRHLPAETGGAEGAHSTRH